jgi:predicted nucleic acid-binding protein
MLIADSSAWVEYLRRTESPADLALDAAVARDEVVVPELVKAELLAGARSNAEVRALETMLEHFDTQLLAPRDDFDHAVKLYLRCRASGYTPRGLMDCAITVMAMRAGLPVLHHDRDFAAIARVAGITQVSGSLVA